MRHEADRRLILQLLVEYDVIIVLVARISELLLPVLADRLVLLVADVALFDVLEQADEALSFQAGGGGAEEVVRRVYRDGRVFLKLIPTLDTRVQNIVPLVHQNLRVLRAVDHVDQVRLLVRERVAFVRFHFGVEFVAVIHESFCCFERWLELDRVGLY